jgi:hypothetical protein
MTGHPSTLVAAHPGNRSAVKSGAFSRTGAPNAERAAVVADAILEAPHTEALDWIAAREIGSLVALIEGIDRDLAKRGAMDNRGAPRKILAERLRASARLEKWLVEFGLTPRSRAEWARTLAEGGLAHEIARRRAANAQDGS